MIRIASLALAVILLAAAPADRNVILTLDGRPVDRKGGIAVLRSGVVYADVVDLVKSFNGLLTFQGRSVVITIGSAYGKFTIGSPTAKIGRTVVALPGRPFVRNGDIYVPLTAFVRGVAHAKVTIAPDRRSADIAVNPNPSN